MLDMSLTLLSVFCNIMVISSIRDKEEFLGEFYFNVKQFVCLRDK